jgi:hypothetical protein
MFAGKARSCAARTYIRPMSCRLDVLSIRRDAASRPKTKEEANVLVYRCAVTDRQVTTGIDTTEEKLARMGSLQISVWCPHCETAHKILAKDAVIVAERRRAPASETSAGPERSRAPYDASIKKRD